MVRAECGKRRSNDILLEQCLGVWLWPSTEGRPVEKSLIDIGGFVPARRNSIANHVVYRTNNHEEADDCAEDTQARLVIP
jgi:hypothetical protein